MKNQKNAEKRPNTEQLMIEQANVLVDEKNPIESVEEKKEPAKHNNDSMDG